MALEARDIITVTQGGLLYYDHDDRVMWIDFEECNINWRVNAAVHGGGDDDRYVGWRNTTPGTVLDVEFFAQPRVRFVFRSYAQRDGLLLNPMRERGGWYTWDVTRSLVANQERK